MNHCILQGALSSSPRSRTLESGTTLTNLEVTTIVEGVSTSVPVVAFDPPSAITSLVAGDEIVVAGHIRRRFFRTGMVTRSVTEVVADRIVRSSHRKRATTLIDREREKWVLPARLKGEGSRPEVVAD